MVLLNTTELMNSVMGPPRKDILALKGSTCGCLPCKIPQQTPLDFSFGPIKYKKKSRFKEKTLLTHAKTTNAHPYLSSASLSFKDHYSSVVL